MSDFSINQKEAFYIADWYIEPSASIIQRDDQSVHLEPKAMDLLVYLAQKPGQVFTRDELLENVWSGVIVSDEALTNAIIKLRKAFNDGAKNPQFIETLPKRGYRLIAPVRFEERDNSESPIESEEKVQPVSTSLSHNTLLIGIVILLLIVSAGFYQFNIIADNDAEFNKASDTRNKLVQSGKPSLAVLPFINASNTTGDTYFSDGITNDLITDLSKVSGLIVISRNSSFAFKGKKPDVQQVSRELNVSHVLEGSVRKSGNTIRINVQLIDATNGRNLWADRYDGDLKDVFGLQDKVTAHIVSTLAVKLTEGEQDLISRMETSNTDAYDSFLRGWEHYLRQRPESFRQAINLFKQALAQDPDYSRAYAALSMSYWQAWKRYWHTQIGEITPHDARFKAEEYLAKAMDKPTPLALQISTAMLAQMGQHDQAVAEGERAIALNPNDPDGFVALAGALNLAGNSQKALTLMEKAMRLNPHYPTSYLHELGLARFAIEEFGEAAVALQQAVSLNPEDRWSSRVLIATLGHLGRLNEAEILIDRVGKSWRGFDPLAVRSVAFWYPFKKVEDAERLAAGLRKAGVPD